MNAIMPGRDGGARGYKDGPRRLALAAQACAGLVQVLRPGAVVRAVQAPDRTWVRVALVGLGVRRLGQALLQARTPAPERPTLLRLGAGLDLGLALAVLPARRRAAVLPAALAALQWAVARQLPRETDAGPATEVRTVPVAAPVPPAPEPVTTVPGISRVAGARSPVWPDPGDAGQHVLVDTAQPERSVALVGGVMDGAVVAVEPDAQEFLVHDADSGPKRYVRTTERPPAGVSAVFRLDRA